jgi:hypothetical protein
MTPEQQTEIERADIIAATVEKMIAENAVLNHLTVGTRIEAEFPGFEYDTTAGDDFRNYIDQSFPEIIGKMAPAKTSDTAAAEPVAEPVVEDPEALRARAHELDQRAGELRARVFALTEARQAARADLAAAIGALVSKLPRKNSDANLRDYLAASQAEREAAKQNGSLRAPSGAFGRSVVDRSASYSHGGGAEDFVRKQMQTGFRRGSAPASQKGRRPPSERG